MHSLNRNHRDYLLRATESMLAAWLHPILAFLCLELGSHKNHSDMETFPGVILLNNGTFAGKTPGVLYWLIFYSL